MQWPLVAALPPLLAIPQLSARIFVDDAVYATIAREMLRGAVPYRDLFDHKPPVIHGWYALMILLGWDSPAELRLSIFLTLGVTALVVLATTRRLYRPGVAFGCAVAFGVSTSLVLMSRNASTEQLMLLPMSLALLTLLAARSTGRARWIVAAGLLTGLAAWTKPVGAVNGAALLAFVVWLPGESVRIPRWRRIGLFIAGAAAISVVVLLPLVTLGIVSQAFDALVVFNREYASSVPWETRVELGWGGAVYYLLAGAPLLAFALPGGYALVREGGERAAILLGWALASVIGATSIGFSFPHYYVQTLPAMALLAGAAFEWIGRPRPRGLLAATAAASVVLAAPTVAGYLEYETLVSEGVPRVPIELETGGTLFVNGNATQFYYETGLQPATRYFYGGALRTRPDAWQEVLRQLVAHPPDMIVDDARPVEWVTETETPPAFTEFLLREYEVVSVTGDVTVYRRLDGDGSSTAR